MRIRNPIFVPGNRQTMLEKAAGFAADCIVLDLEDSVPLGEKENARRLVALAIPSLARAGQRIVVRVNALHTGLTSLDLEAATGPSVDGISIGKVRSVADIADCDQLLSAAESKVGLAHGQIRLIPWLETAAGIVRGCEIASASPRILAIAFGAEDYTREIGVPRTDEGVEIQYARAAVALAAHAAGVIPLDTPYMPFRDLAGLERDSAVARQLGFKGKFAVHPDQLTVIRKTFSPNPEEVDYARRVVEAWDVASAKGRGAIDLEGKLIDVPVVERARKLLEEASDSSAAAPGRES
ncbi:MAG: CoA ester lyase [Chloroflexi bacterium]|nr:CoA ester lyase [Chloroflexota bacterium]